MEALVEQAIKAIDANLAAILAKDYARFVTAFTPRIKERITPELFEAAVSMMQRQPLDRKIINPQTCQVTSDGAVKLKMTNGRTLCTVYHVGDQWLVDNIYWK